MRVPYAQHLGKVPFKAVAIVIGAGAVAAAGFAALSWTTANASRPTATAEPVTRPARVMEIAYQRRSQSLVLAGTVVPRIETNLGFRVPGKIVIRSVDVGTIVKPGDLIAQLDPADHRLAVDNARAALASAEADYARARADHERYLNLRGTAVFTAQTMEQRQSLAATAQARVEQARSQLSSAENNLTYTELRSDTAGVVTAVQAEVGQVMAQGQGVVRVARTDELEIVVGVPEHRLKTVRESRAASFELWSDPGQRHPVRLRELSPSADPMTRTYPARFGIAAPNQFGKIYVLPPGAPQDRTSALQAAFTKTFEDKEFLAEADKGRLEIDPVGAQQAHGLITDLMGMSPAVKAQLQKMLRTPK